MEVALPASVDFARRQPELPDSTTSTLMSISPNNGLSFTSGQQITFDLPSRQGLFIDGKSVYLRFRLNVVGVTGTSYIRRKFQDILYFPVLTSMLVGSIVNTISQYNQVSNMLIDINYSASDVLGQTFSWGISAGAGGIIDANGLFDLDSAEIAIGQNDIYIAVPLVGSFLQGMDKLFPTGLAPPVRIQLLCETIANIFSVAANITSYTIISPELCFSAIDMGSQVDQMIAANSPQLFIKTRAYANGTQGMPAGSGSSMSLIYNHRYSSVENFYFLSTTSDVTKGVNLWGDSFLPFGTNTTAGSIQLTIGQTQIPQLPLQNLTGGRACNFTDDT